MSLMFDLIELRPFEILHAYDLQPSGSTWRIRTAGPYTLCSGLLFLGTAFYLSYTSNKS